MSEYGIIALPCSFTPYPSLTINIPLHIKYQMEEFMTFSFYRVQNLVDDRLISSDPISYATKWDTLRTSTDTVLLNLKFFSFEPVTSSRQKHGHLEEKLAFVVVKQEDMDVQFKTIIARQDEMGSDLRLSRSF